MSPRYRLTQVIEDGLPPFRLAPPVPSQDRSLVHDLGRDQVPCKPQTGCLVETHAVLRRAHLDIAVAKSMGDPSEPSAVAFKKVTGISRSNSVEGS